MAKEDVSTKTHSALPANFATGYELLLTNQEPVDPWTSSHLATTLLSDQFLSTLFKADAAVLLLKLIFSVQKNMHW